MSFVLNLANALHKARHATGGPDAIAPADIGATTPAAASAAAAALIASEHDTERAHQSSTYVASAGTDPANIPILKPSGDNRVGNWEYIHNSATGYLWHLLAGANMATPAALMAMGIDNGTGTGLLVANKAQGVGILVNQMSTISSASAYGIKVTNSSLLAPAVRIEQNVNGAGDGIQILALSATPTASQHLLYTSDTVGEAWSVYAQTGMLFGQRNLVMRDSTAAPSNISLTTNVGTDSSNTSKTFLGCNSLTTYGKTGSPGMYWPSRIQWGGNQGLVFQTGGAVTTADPLNPQVTEGSFSTMLAIAGSNIGLYGVTPVARAAAIATPTSDTVGCKAAVDAIRTALKNLGLTS